jgi:hypothetical protein
MSQRPAHSQFYEGKPEPGAEYLRSLITPTIIVGLSPRNLRNFVSFINRVFVRG